jgi:hypothetical protein
MSRAAVTREADPATLDLRDRLTARGADVVAPASAAAARARAPHFPRAGAPS